MMPACLIAACTAVFLGLLPVPGLLLLLLIISSGPPIGGNDTFTFADPEGPEGPGSVTVHVLDNDVDPDGTAVHITPGI
jgi:hypothetical protein